MSLHGKANANLENSSITVNKCLFKLVDGSGPLIKIYAQPLKGLCGFHNLLLRRPVELWFDLGTQRTVVDNLLYLLHGKGKVLAANKMSKTSNTRVSKLTMQF